MPLKCPKCSSTDVTVLDEELELVHCNKCDYDELEEEVVPTPRSSQREKARFTPYKAGGKGRGRKK